MLEIIGIILLCQKNSKNAAERGKKPAVYVVLTIILWVGFEFIGVRLGNAADLGIGASSALALFFALIGVGFSYLAARSGDVKPA